MEIGGFGREIALGGVGKEAKGFNTEDTENGEKREGTETRYRLNM
jgi:hypothetical protein